MSRSAIYTVNQSVQEVSVNGVISPGTVIRRFGPNINLSGNAIQINGAGYYLIDTSITIVPSAEGEVTVTAYVDGAIIPGMIATETAAAAGDSANISLTGIYRKGCQCCDGLSSITFVVSDGATNVTNIAVTVEKL